MTQIMRCLYCGLLQDEPAGVKECQRCGGELAYENAILHISGSSYLQAQLELDQVQAPAFRNIDRYLLATLKTPIEVPKEFTLETPMGHPPLNVTIVLDVSGSMQGQKIAFAKEALRQVIHYLGDKDYLSLVVFSNQVRSLIESSSVNSDIRRQVSDIMREIVAGGTTNLCGGLIMGVEMAMRNTQTGNLLILLSDGQANVGETDLEKIGGYALEGRNKGLITSTIGIGQDYNEALMVEISNQGGGRFYHLVNPGQIPSYLKGELGEIAAVSCRNTELKLNLPVGVALIPLYSTFPAEQENSWVSISVGDIPVDTEIEIPLRVTFFAQPEGQRLSIDGEVIYLTPTGKLLSTQLNKVTVRFVEESKFQFQQGTAIPVVEKVFHHLQASYIIDVSRASELNFESGRIMQEAEASTLRQYSRLLGDETGKEIDDKLYGSLNIINAPASTRKSRVADAVGFIRKAKKFDQ